MMMNAVTDLLQNSLRFARGLSDPDGRMRDPYETEYGENFAPACFSVVAAALHRLHGRPEDLDWVGRWSRRSATIMRESPYLREYMLGYTAMIFGLLKPGPELEQIRQDFIAASQPAEPLSPLAHILALQLVGDVLCPRGPASAPRAETIVSELERLWTPAGFAEDRKEGDDGSIPHAYLTVATLCIFLVARPATETARRLQPRIEALIARACDWFYRANGNAMIAVQANRSYNQLWVYPLFALLAYAHRGPRAAVAVEQSLAIVNCATGRRERANFLPTELSPYASAGNEPYNRVNNDVGAGGVGWALLAILQAEGFAGLAGRESALAPVLVDAKAGYAFFHDSASGVALPLHQHRWRYHYPLQPAWVVVGGAGVPFVGAKRSGVNNPYANLLKDPARVSPLLEPYFGVMAGKDGTFHVMQEPVEARPDNVFCATLRPEGSSLETVSAPARVSVQVMVEANALALTYRILGEAPGELWLSVPILLWDGAHELQYRIEGPAVALGWAGRNYTLRAGALDGDPGNQAGRGVLAGSWTLRRERFLHTGFGVTGNFVIALGSIRTVRVRLESQETKL